jgi:formylglycine-generating enzyme
MIQWRNIKITGLCLAIIVPVLFQACTSKSSKSTKGAEKAGSSKTTSRSNDKGKKGKSVKDKQEIGIINGEIVAQERKGWQQTTPNGMVLVPSGSFMMGQADEDIAATQINMNKRVTVSPFFMDDTEISNNEYRQFVNSLLADSVQVLGEEWIMKNMYPDTTVWKHDFTYHNGDPMTEYYFSAPAFDMYPVVGVNWKGAKYFAQWRSNILNDYRSKEGLYKSPRFRLPTETEWEWASRGGKATAKYPWGGPYVANAKGCMLANFKPQRGNYDSDGYTYTAPVNQFGANDFGLYNMSGNVAEWTNDAYAPNASVVAWDLNPEMGDDNEPRKIVRGGSWKDVAYYLETGTRTYEYEDTKRSYIGFRCVMDYLGRSSGREFK